MRRISPPPKPRVRRRTILLTCTAFLVSSGASLFLAASCRPAWYQPLAIDPGRLPADKRELVALLDGIGAALNSGRAARIELDRAQVNRWITSRAELLPEAALELGPVRNPLISFRADGLRVAALVEWHGWRFVASAVVRVELNTDQVLVTLDEARLGVLPIPRRWLTSALDKFWVSRGVQLTRLDTGRIALANDFVWPNGKRRCKINAIELSAERVRLTTEPLTP